MKFFTSDGGLDKADITDICSTAARDCEAAPGGHAIVTPAGVEQRPFLLEYAAQLRQVRPARSRRLNGGQGGSLLPPYTRGSVCLLHIMPAMSSSTY